MVVEQGVTGNAADSHASTTAAKCGNGLSAAPLLPQPTPPQSLTSPGTATATSLTTSSVGAAAAAVHGSSGDPHPQHNHYYNHYPHHHHHHHNTIHHRYPTPVYNAEHARMEAWMDENPEFMQDYIIRKATRQVVDAWLVNHATPNSSTTDLLSSPTASHYLCSGSGAAGPGNGSGLMGTATLGTPVNGQSGSSLMGPNANPCSSRGGSGATTPVR